MKKLISIILPVYNEEKNLPLFYDALADAVSSLKGYDFEFIFVNDGSSDNSWHIIENLASKDSRICGINFSRNFSQQMALTAGYHAARGEAAISMDTDMQNPPELIPHLLAAWQSGPRIVYARRTASHDRWLKKITSHWFNKLIYSISDITMPQHIGYFILIDRCVIDVINTLPERSRFLRGLIAWTGFESTYVDFDQPERAHGQTAYSWKQLCGIAFDAIVGFSRFPVKIPFYLGILFCISTIISLLTSAWLAAAICMILGIQFFMFWLLGEYIIRIYEQARHRPLYIIAKTVGKSHQGQQE